MEKPDFGTRVRIARGEAGLSVEHLAKLAGLSPAGISLIESGASKRPRIQTVAKLAEALHIPTAELLGYALEGSEK